MTNRIHIHKIKGSWGEAIVSVVDPRTHTRKKFRLRWRGGYEVPTFWWNHPHGLMCPKASTIKEVSE